VLVLPAVTDPARVSCLSHLREAESIFAPAGAKQIGRKRAETVNPHTAVDFGTLF